MIGLEGQEIEIDEKFWLGISGKWYTLGDEPGDHWAVDMRIFMYRIARPIRLDTFSFKIALDTYKIT